MPVSKRTAEQATLAELVPYWRSPCGRVTVYVGDCREVMAKMEPQQFHAVVSDPPYGLEFMGLEFDAPWKHQMGRRKHIKEVAKILATTFFDVVFPSYNQLVSESFDFGELDIPALRSAQLAFMDRAIWEESRVTVPEGAVDFDHRIVFRGKKVKDADILTSIIPDSDLLEKLDAYSSEEGAYFFLNLRPCGNPSFGDGLRCLVSECGNGVLRVPIIISLDSCLAGFLHSFPQDSDTFIGHVVRFINNALGSSSRPPLVMTSAGAELGAVLSLDLRNGAAELLPTDGALQDGFMFELRCAKLIGASARAGGLPSVFQTRVFRLIGVPANRTLSICFHSAIIPHIEFMGNEWDAPRKAGGSTDARARCAGELVDPIKAKYLRHGVTYGGTKSRGGGRTEVCDEGTDASHPFRDGPHRVVYRLSDPQAYQAWFKECTDAILRVCRPGAHFLSFGGTRMWHRMACAIQDAGFDIRDTVMWVYGSGFPKSHDVSKGIDRMYGHREYDPADKRERTDAGQPALVGPPQGRKIISQTTTVIGVNALSTKGVPSKVTYSEPCSEDAKVWDGWGTALKPAHEPVIVARAPLAGTVAHNTLEHGCGGVNVDGCRIGTGDTYSYPNEPGGKSHHYSSDKRSEDVRPNATSSGPKGRWPANLVLSHRPECRMVGARAARDTVVETVSTGEVVSDNVAMSGPNYGPAIVGAAPRPNEEVWECHADCPTQAFPKAGGGASGNLAFATGIGGEGKVLGDKERSGAMVQTYADSGSAARFFYTSKAGEDDRPHGKGSVAHPTVKPLDLMRWLVRLVCAPGGTVLDPFMGSGSTGCAAIVEGMRFVGVEQNKEYADLAVGRLKMALSSIGVKDTPPPPTRLRGAK